MPTSQQSDPNAAALFEAYPPHASAFLAPEQLAPALHDMRGRPADIFAIGLIILHCEMEKGARNIGLDLLSLDRKAGDFARRAEIKIQHALRNARKIDAVGMHSVQELISACLAVDPRRRPSARAVLHHKGLHADRPNAENLAESTEVGEGTVNKMHSACGRRQQQ